MNADPVRAIAQAVLYEGYLLWPYRRSALKNQHRFTIGGLYPYEYAARFGDRSRARFSCLLEGETPSLELEVRFLRVVRRQVVRDGDAIDSVTIGDERYLSWDEAREESFVIPAVDAPLERPMAFESGSAEEILDARTSLVRSWAALSGGVRVDAVPAGGACRRVTVQIANDDRSEGATREDALRRTFASAHVVLRVRDGAFVSTIDPPPALRQAAAMCEREGLWPALVGDPGARDTLLAAPVIVGDYPQIAPESYGDYFDGGEVDELLVHSIRALTQEEQHEMRATDPRAREILERTLRLTPLQVERLHGAVREQRRVEM